MPDPLRALGWDDRFAVSLATVRDAIAVRRRRAGEPGRVLRVDRGGWLTAETAAGEVRARLHPRFRRPASPLDVPTVGDWIVVPTATGVEPVVEVVVPRRTALVRNAGGDDRDVGQLLAANVDVVLVALPLDGNRSPRRTDRFLTLAWSGGAEPVLLLTKADEVSPEEADVAASEARSHGAPVHVISVRTGAGLDALAPYLRVGRTLVLVGISGAGKSTLANHLLGAETLVTGEVRRDGKGRHTTTHRELVRLPSGGVLIDTPGLRSIATWDEGGEHAFADVEELAHACRFADCAHGHEPDCAVQEAVDDGALDPARLDSYLTLRGEHEALAARRDAAGRGDRRQRPRSESRTLRPQRQPSGRGTDGTPRRLPRR